MVGEQPAYKPGCKVIKHSEFVNLPKDIGSVIISYWTIYQKKGLASFVAGI